MKPIKSILIKVIAICLVFALSVPITVYATGDMLISPCASYYLDTYNTYICRVGTNGQIQIWFDVMGTGTMDEIGVLSIELYEVDSNGNETWLKTYQHEDYSSMLIEDDWVHCSYVSYQVPQIKPTKPMSAFGPGKTAAVIPVICGPLWCKPYTAEAFGHKILTCCPRNYTNIPNY